MRMMLVVAALLLASPLSAQAGERMPADAWRTLPLPDARLSAGLGQARHGDVMTDDWRGRLQLHHWGLLGAAAGCISGALIMGAAAEDGEVAVMRFNGCILGASVGGFLGGIYGLATGA